MQVVVLFHKEQVREREQHQRRQQVDPVPRHQRELAMLCEQRTEVDEAEERAPNPHSDEEDDAAAAQHDAGVRRAGVGFVDDVEAVRNAEIEQLRRYQQRRDDEVCLHRGIFSNREAFDSCCEAVKEYRLA